MSSVKMEPDPDGLSQQVAVIMTGKVYREAGLKHSKHPEVEGLLYDRLCQIGKHKLRDDVRRMALSIAIGVRDKEFQPTVAWLDNFMRRFCLSKKKMGFHSVAMLKTKIAQNTTPAETASNEKGVTQEEVFSALGFPKDFTGFGENLEQGLENGSSTGNAATAGGKTSGAENGISESGAKQDGDASDSGDPLVLNDSETSALNSTNEDKPSNSGDKASNEVEEVDPLQIEKKDEVMEVDPLGGDDDEDDVSQGDKNEKDKENGNEKQKGKDTAVDKKGKSKGDNEEKDSEEVEQMSTSSLNPNEEEEEDQEDGATSNGSGESEDEADKDKGKKAKEKEVPENEEEMKSKAEDESILYTKEENRYFKKNIENLQKRLTLSVVRCSSCFEQVNHQLPTLVHTHPVLGIFICKRCRKYYGKGKYCKDDDGYDEYCRLCAEGGDLLCCEQKGCFNGFCKRCIKRVLGRTELRNAEKAKNWACYVCNKEPLMELRALHRALLQNLKEEEVKKSNLSRKELHSKEIKNKFALLKKTMIEKKQKQIVTKDEKTVAPQEESWLRDIINNLSEMLQICFSNIDKIESVWVKHKYSEEATKKTASRLIKQLDAMQQNCLLMKEDLVLQGGESSINESVEGGSSDSKKVSESKNKDKAGKVGDQSKCIEEEGDLGKSAEGSKKKEKSTSKKNESEEMDDSPEETKAGIDPNAVEENGPDAAEESDGNKDKPLEEEESPADTEEGVVGSNEGNSSEASSSDKKKGRGRPRKPDVKDGKVGKFKEENTDKDKKVDDEDKTVDDKDEKVDDKDEKVDDKDEKVDDKDEKVDDKDEPPKTRGRPKKSASVESKSTEEEETSNGDAKRTPRSKLAKLDKDDDKGKDTDNSVQSTEDTVRRRGRSKKLVEKTPASGEKKEDSTTKRRGRSRKSLLGDEESEGSEPMNKEDDKGEANDDANSTEVCADVDESNDIPASSNELDDNDADEEESDPSGKEKKCESPNVKDVKKSSGKVKEDVVKTPKKGVKDSEEDEKSKDTEEKSAVNKESRKSPRKGKNKDNNDDSDDNAKDSEEDKKSEDTKEKVVGRKSLRKGKNEDNDDDGDDNAKDSKEDKKSEEDTKEKVVGRKSLRKGKNEDNGDDNAKDSKEDKKDEEDTKEKVVGRKSPRKGKNKDNDDDSDDNAKDSEEDKKSEDTKEKAIGKKSPKKGKKKGKDDDSDDSAAEEVTEKGKMKKGSKLSPTKITVEETESDSCDEKESKNKEKMDKGKKGKKGGKVKKEEDEDGETDVKKEKNVKGGKKDGEKKRKRKDSDGNVTPEEVVLKRSKKKSDDNSSDSEDSLLGIGSDDSDDNRRKKKKKRDSGDLLYNEKGMRSKSSSKKLSKRELELKKKNKAALSSLLNSNSEEDSDSDGDEGKEKGKAKKSKKSGAESSDTDISVDGFRKKGKNKGKKSGLNDNEKAKDALLESESSDDIEDKPKPKCKKKIKPSKGPRSADETRRHRLRSQRAKLSEEEREKLEKQQLEGKAIVPVEPLDPDLVKVLKEGDFVDITDYPDLLAKLEQDQDTYDGDAEEEDSDREFSKLMKFDVNTKFCKPGPKSKKKFLLPDDDDDDQDTSSENEESNGSNEQKENEPKGKKPAQKKKEGLLDIDIDQDQDQDEDEVEEESFSKKKKKGGITLNEKLKKNLLLSSDEEEDDDEEEEDNEEEKMAEREMEEREKIKHEMKKIKTKKKKGDDDDDEEEEEAPKVRKKGYMKLDITSDEDDEDFKPEKDDGDGEDDEDDEDADSDFEESPRKRRTFQLSSSDSDSSTNKKKKKRKKDDDSDYEGEEEFEEETPKGKRKRIKKVSSSSEGDGEGEEGSKEDSPSKHKKIRRVIRDEDLTESTKNATQEEEERRKRILERQKQFNQIFEIDVESDQKEEGKLVLDFDPDSKKELVRVNEKLVKFLKPHQVKGVKFMWDSTIESLEMLEKKAGSGCILAHCMGLGKTLQVITYVHTLLTNKKASRTIQRVMVCCPVNTVYNWVSEFKNWLKGKMLSFEVWELVSAKDLWARAYRLDDWWKEGGICVMGYDMFRNLSNPKSKRFKVKMREIFLKALVDPGPDVMVCDEGHLLKNEKTALSKAINKIKTSRRIILTGTPLQNNLKEYHCMIQFVKPNLLGTKKEFMNRFVNPIELGQCAEAEQRDVRRMKRRAHILHNLLEGCVQRFDYTVLKPFLPPKFEYVISIQLSDIQVALYRYYLENLAQGGPKRQGSGLFVDYGALSRVWTHPKVLEFAVRRALLQDDEDDLEDFICDDTTTDESSEDERSKKKKGKKKTKKDDDDDYDEDIEEEEVDKDEAGEPDGTKMNSKKAQNGPLPGLTASGKVRVDWWKKVVMDKVGERFEEEDYLDRIEHSGKLILLLDILRESSSIGDKVLVFSQSLLALDMMEEFLQMIDQGELEMPEPEEQEGQEPLPIPFKKWKKDRDYLRLDGSTNADSRKYMCKTFNNTSNERCRLFLISTRAGGLGINLVAANRVIIFDSSWNPSHDSQSIFRVYRFGQKKPCYVYRFVAQGTMEEKIYSRQVTKMSTALRVVDEHQIKRYFKMADLQQLYEFTPSDKDTRETPAVPEDRLLAELLKRQKDWIVNYHEHDSLLENQTGEELSEEERKAAWEDYENEKKGFLIQNQRNTVMPVVGAMGMGTNVHGMPSLSMAPFSFEGVVNTIKAQNPLLSQNELCESVVLATKQIQRIHLNHYQRVQGMVYNLKNPMIAPEQRKLLPFGTHPEMLPLLEQQLRLLEDNIQRENQVINHMTQITPQRKDTYASMLAAGLVRGQPVKGEKSFSADYVERSTSAASTSTSSTNQQNPTTKKVGTGDVIMID